MVSYMFTYGIRFSPFLASKALLHVAKDNINEFPRAAQVVQPLFYVDDCLTVADSLTKVKQLRADLNSLLFFENSNLMISPSECPIYWNTATDTLHVCTPSFNDIKVPTKCQLASAVGRTSGVGWCCKCSKMHHISVHHETTITQSSSSSLASKTPAVDIVSINASLFPLEPKLQITCKVILVEGPNGKNLLVRTLLNT